MVEEAYMSESDEAVRPMHIMPMEAGHMMKLKVALAHTLPQ